MATDYDAPRTRSDSDPAPDGGLRLDTRRSDAAAATLTLDDDDDTGYGSAVDLLLELSTGDEVSVTGVVAQRRDEFTCTRCFLIQHCSRHARTASNAAICRDCA